MNVRNTVHRTDPNRRGNSDICGRSTAYRRDSESAEDLPQRLPSHTQKRNYFVTIPYLRVNSSTVRVMSWWSRSAASSGVGAVPPSRAGRYRRSSPVSGG